MTQLYASEGPGLCFPLNILGQFEKSGKVRKASLGNARKPHGGLRGFDSKAERNQTFRARLSRTRSGHLWPLSQVKWDLVNSTDLSIWNPLPTLANVSSQITASTNKSPHCHEWPRFWDVHACLVLVAVGKVGIEREKEFFSHLNPLTKTCRPFAGRFSIYKDKRSAVAHGKGNGNKKPCAIAFISVRSSLALRLHLFRFLSYGSILKQYMDSVSSWHVSFAQIGLVEELLGADWVQAGSFGNGLFEITRGTLDAVIWLLAFWAWNLNSAKLNNWFRLLIEHVILLWSSLYFSLGQLHLGWSRAKSPLAE